MSERPRLISTDQALAAFADGELDGEQQLTVLQHVAAHAETAARVEREVRLRNAVARVMTATPLPSAALRDRLGAMADTIAAEEAASLRIPTPVNSSSPPDWKPLAGSGWFIGRTLPLAAAASVAFLLLGLWAGRAFLAKPSDSTTALQTSTPVPATLIAAATHTHVDCSRMRDLHTGTWPQALGDLGPPLLAYLGRTVPYPDLSPIGYAYIGAGPCDKPMEHAAHLLYRSTKPGVSDTVSLFVQKDEAKKVPVEEGKVYRAAGPDSAHPMFVWRHGVMVFYLLGDAEEPVESVAKVMHVPLPA